MIKIKGLCAAFLGGAREGILEEKLRRITQVEGELPDEGTVAVDQVAWLAFASPPVGPKVVLRKDDLECVGMLLT